MKTSMKTMAWLVAAASIAVAAPASATTYVMTLDGGGTNVGGSNNGNVRTYSSTVSGQTLTLQASGWTDAVDQNPAKILSSYLGAYAGSGYGLGITNPGENGNNNSHVVDNVSQQDFILLKFSTAVDLTSMFLNVFDVNSAGNADSDATVYYKNGATAPTNNELKTSYIPQFTAIGVPGGSTSGSRTVDVGGNYSDTWLVSADVNGSNDGFKLYSVTVNTGAVPEPASWALMIVGFGGIGAVMRRRRTEANVATA